MGGKKGVCITRLGLRNSVGRICADITKKVLLMLARR
jgi:hypothetical protein